MVGENVEMCNQLEFMINEIEYPLIYLSKTRTVGLLVLDGGSSYIVLDYCPFCGQKLLSSLSDIWFDHLDELDMDLRDVEPGSEWSNDRWWRGRFPGYTNELLNDSWGGCPEVNESE